MTFYDLTNHVNKERLLTDVRAIGNTLVAYFNRHGMDIPIIFTLDDIQTGDTITPLNNCVHGAIMQHLKKLL